VKASVLQLRDTVFTDARTLMVRSLRLVLVATAVFGYAGAPRPWARVFGSQRGSHGWTTPLVQRDRRIRRRAR
jgi:hypothetical protein